tara:strand:- start:543 stop:1145 length:603 start_codon:yes stop_codon:yes gene_type:complete
MTRKNKLRVLQFSLLIIGISIIYFTYYKKEETAKQEIIPKQTQERIKNQIANQPEGYEVFSNIEYSGLDLSGNRYILKAKQAYNKEKEQEVVNLISVEAFFYFKDNTVLKVISEKGTYNNKTLDMNFYDNIKAIYQNSLLFAQKAKYSNQNGNLIISEKVKLEDKQGTIFADKLLFDIKKQTLNVKAFKDNKINGNINLK